MPMEEFATTLPVLWKWLLGLCGMIVAMGGAAAVLAKVFAPVKAFEKRLDALEKKHSTDQQHNEECLKNDLESLTQQKDYNNLMCHCLLALLDHQITGNSIEKMKRTRDEMTEFLIERKM